MTGKPRVRVRSIRLDEGTPVALRDTLSVYDLGIDFTAKPEDIAAALQEILQEGIDSGRWARIPTQRGAGIHEEAGPES